MAGPAKVATPIPSLGSEALAQPQDGQRGPLRALRRSDAAPVKLVSGLVRGQVCKLSQDRAQFLGPALSLRGVLVRLGIAAAQLHTAGLCSLQRKPRALADDATLPFCQCGEQASVSGSPLALGGATTVEPHANVWTVSVRMHKDFLP